MAARLAQAALKLDEGDLVLRQGALETIEGAANLRQALELRILTPLGDDPFNTAYGLDNEQIFTQPVGAHEARELIKLNLVRTLSTDPRVQEVTDVVFVDDPTDEPDEPAEAEAARRRRRSRLWIAQATVVTVDGETQALEVGVEA